jgi:DMSO/TMAO reductase YedYZ molybdopterin-dependent catalytic subunit
VNPLAPVATWRDRTGEDTRHDDRTAAILGIALGVCFTTCFLTGLYSHYAQHPPSWFHLPARPVGLYRVTQGVHVLTGIAAIPLLLAKLWAVFPRLVQWPPVRSVAHLLERISLIPLVAGALFQLWTGLANIDLWYPLPSFFPTTHYWMAWITMGALVTHVGAKITTTRAALARHREPLDPDDRRSRRRFLTAVGATSSLLVVTVAGQTISPLRKLALLAPRHPDEGVQGFPVNKSAISAGVRSRALSPSYRLAVSGRVSRPLTLSLDDLRSMHQHSAVLPIACVEGWSASRRWTGVRLGDLLSLAGAPSGASATVHSLETGGLYARSDVDADQVAAPDTLLALQVDGETLALDHGFPVRLIGPNRPGVMQTKWVAEVVAR